LITGIVIGRESRGPETPDQVFLNAAPGTPSSRPEAQAQAEAKTGTQRRAPLGEVVRPTPSRAPAAKRGRPTPKVSTSPRNSIPGSYETARGERLIGPNLGQEETNGSHQFSTLESEVVRLTNVARRERRCRPLRIDPRLVRSARNHSIEMAQSDYFAHNSPDGSSPWERMERAGYPNGGAENIGRGYLTADEAVRGWMGSRSHRANILNCSLTAIGVGVASGPGGLWWTQDFGYS
jgi:uncharacterized protein YkwD